MQPEPTHFWPIFRLWILLILQQNLLFLKMVLNKKTPHRFLFGSGIPVQGVRNSKIFGSNSGDLELSKIVDQTPLDHCWGELEVFFLVFLMILKNI